jgi:hypothetical protein
MTQSVSTGYGNGRVFRRGRRWFAAVYDNGAEIYAASHSENRVDAERLLKTLLTARDARREIRRHLELVAMTAECQLHGHAEHFVDDAMRIRCRLCRRSAAKRQYDQTRATVRPRNRLRKLQRNDAIIEKRWMEALKFLADHVTKDCSPDAAHLITEAFQSASRIAALKYQSPTRRGSHQEATHQ